MRRMTDKFFNNTIDNSRIADAMLRTSHRIERTEVTYERFDLGLDELQTGPEGCATVKVYPDDGFMYHFDISLAPANATRLIEFLRSLPSEPQEG